MWKSLFIGKSKRPELDRLLEAAKNISVTDAELREQRISFVYGNALGNPRITKESVRAAAESIRLHLDNK
jgi:hypothetical protein